MQSTYPRRHQVLAAKKGASLQKVDRGGLTPLQLAAGGVNGCSNTPAMKILLDHEDVSVDEKISALELAVSVLITKSDEWGLERKTECIIRDKP